MCVCACMYIRKINSSFFRPDRLRKKKFLQKVDSIPGDWQFGVNKLTYFLKTTKCFSELAKSSFDRTEEIARRPKTVSLKVRKKTTLQMFPTFFWPG